MLVYTDDASGNVAFPDTDVTSDVSNSIEISASFIQHISDSTGETLSISPHFVQLHIYIRT